LPILVGFFCLAAPLPSQNSQREVPPAAVGGSGENPPLSTLSVTSEQSRSSDYVIGPEDVLDIDVFNVPELTKTVRVANDGTISLALLGHVQAAGCTTEQLRKELERRWGQSYLENPQVTVFVREFHAQPVSVIGAVERPGIYELKGPRTLIEILSMAGGLAKVGTAPGRTIVVTRRGGFGEELQLVEGMNLVGADKVEINLQRLLYSREAGLNIDIKPFDTVSVSRADIVYVVGDVKRPGGFVLADRENLTVLQALALAEGLNGTASKRQARIIRRNADGSRTEIPVDLTKVLNGKSQDLELAANDILFVPVSAGKAAAKRGAEAAIATVSGLLIWRR
jgi:polysaccharide export outer membrane protein